jgi:hypothetical protein
MLAAPRFASVRGMVLCEEFAKATVDAPAGFDCQGMGMRWEPVDSRSSGI